MLEWLLMVRTAKKTLLNKFTQTSADIRSQLVYTVGVTQQTQDMKCLSLIMMHTFPKKNIFKVINGISALN